jgi:hypothetical protein
VKSHSQMKDLNKRSLINGYDEEGGEGVIYWQLLSYYFFLVVKMEMTVVVIRKH